MAKHGGRDTCGTCGGSGSIEVEKNGKGGPKKETITCGACGGSGKQ
jgi:DnaJ-class molecular chaperone